MMDKFSDDALYWEWIRLSLSANRSDRLVAENDADEAFAAWLRTSRNAELGTRDSVSTIVGVMSEALDTREMRYVCNDLVEVFLEAGGSFDELVGYANEVFPDSVPVLVSWHAER